MEVFFTKRAKQALEGIIDFVESKNTPESGNKFALKFEHAIKQFAIANVTYVKCNHISLNNLGYSCITISKWIIAFKIKDNKFIIYRIIWGALLR
jgi:hypothetical protein